MLSETAWPPGEGESLGMNGHLCKWGRAGEEDLGAEPLSTLHKVRVRVPSKAGVSPSCFWVPPSAPR